MALRLTVALSVAALGASLSATPARAQMRGGMNGFAPSHGATITFGGGGAVRIHPGARGHRRFFRRPILFPYPYIYPFDDGYDEGVAQPEQPPVQVVVVNPQPEKAYAPPVPPVESLLLQYQDGQWVRVPTGEKVPVGPLSAQPEPAQGPAPKANAASGGDTAQAPPRLRNVILVFRDGHKEEIQKYMMQGNALYVSEPYWKTGSWTNKIPISDLDVAATVELNRERGVKFDLPSGPNEVVVGF